jgi:predicted Zn-dependent protease
MERLSNARISEYLQRVSVLDKAGSFDIQGAGGMLVRRIEGCYFNVVGLPLVRLYKLLKKAGAFVLVLGCAFGAAGCATEFNLGTKTEDVMFYSTDREVAIGDSIAGQLEKDYTVIQDLELNERLRRIGEKVVASCDRRELLYRFRVIEDKKDPEIVNAVSLPGGYVYVFKNLLQVADTDDELAAVVAHEVGHIVGRHSMKLLQAEWGYNVLAALSIATKNAEVAGGAQLAYLHVLMGYSQEMELEADRMGARYAKRAGYKPEGMIAFLEKLTKRRKKEKAQPLSYFRTHPYTANRIKAVKMELGQGMSFEDFINTQ